jgi:hypothetical protein
VIMTTGRAPEEVARDCACDVLPKPFTEAALLDLVGRLMPSDGRD